MDAEDLLNEVHRQIVYSVGFHIGIAKSQEEINKLTDLIRLSEKWSSTMIDNLDYLDLVEVETGDGK